MKKWNLSARAGRLARVATLGLFSLTLVPAGIGQAAAERPVDFGAALLMPADVAQFGFEDYGIDSGRYMTVAQMLAEGSNYDPTDEDIDALGMESVHNLMVHPIGGIEEHPGPDITIVSFIYVYEDEDHADEAFDFLEDESDDPTATDLEDAPELGDESELTETIAEFQDGGETYDLHALDFSFRIGRVTAIVSVNGWNDEVDRDTVEEMAAFFEEKLIGVMEDGRVDGERTPGLDSIAPRYDSEDLIPSRSHYCVLNGEALINAYNPDAQESLQEWADDYGVVADYCSLTKVMLPSTDGAYLLLNTQPTRFARSEDAARFVSEEDEYAQDQESGYDNLEIIDLEPEDLPFDADSVLAMTYTRDFNGEEMTVTDLFVQQGRLVVEVRINGYSEPDLDMLIDVMADAFGCSDSACYQTLEAPDSLLDFQAEQDELLAEQE
jgi:hypothetical protein